MTHYLIQTLVFQLLFLVVYEFLLKRETFFQWNRVYLLLTISVSMVLPLIKIPGLVEVAPQTLAILLPEVILGNATAGLESENVSNTVSIWKIIYTMGLVFSSLIFIKKIIELFRLKRKGEKTQSGHIAVITLPNSTLAFSFVNTIFIGKNINKESKKSIIAHEMVHIKQKHFLDLLYFELIRIVFWFNPMVYIFQKRISVLHEYIADKETVSQIESKAYYQAILSQVFQTQNISFINTFFNQSFIKKRIIMLQKSNSKKIFQWKYALTIPVLFGMLLYTSCSQEESKTGSVSETLAELKYVIENDTAISETQRKEYQNWLKDLEQKQKITSSNSYDEQVMPFAVVEQVPVFPGCMGDNELLKQCMSEKITQVVLENFDTTIGEKLGLTGRQRISVQFKIDTDGNVIDAVARSENSELSDEALRVISLLPQMTPGEHEGKKVPIVYSLPILFEI